MLTRESKYDSYVSHAAIPIFRLRNTMKLLLLLFLNMVVLTSSLFAAGPKSFLDGLIFHAPFDGGADARLAVGDGGIYTAPPSRDPTESKPGLDPKVVAIGKGKGRYGDALHFMKKSREMVFFHGEKNTGYRAKDWSGTISVWLSLDPADLKQQFADPVQITDKKYNNSAFWVDFTKDDTPPHFRMGVFPDWKVWNPEDLKQNKVPESEQPIVRAKGQHFGHDKWTHVVMTFSGFNTEGTGGTAKLYINGNFQATVKNRRQVFTWELSKTTIRLGLGYVGLLDELSIFNRTLNAYEVQTLYKLPAGLSGLSSRRK
jgi:hypothetical protein